MRSIYARWIDRWERRLAFRDINRVVRPFEWGLDWLGLIPDGDPRPALETYAAQAVACSDEFYAHRTPPDFLLDGTHLTFTSSVASPFAANNLVHAEIFEPGNARGRAVIVLPQWNADESGHAGLCRLIRRFGVTAVRMSLAYHDRRKPAETERADYHVSSNIGRTIHACRQSVVDARACLDWLETRGYNRLGILGTSLGSCIAFITAVHDRRLRVAVLNHVSTYFGDVVWTGLSTRHVRQGLGEGVTQEELRRYWAAISPAAYFGRLKGSDLKTLLVSARYDTTFLPRFSHAVIEAFRAAGVDHRVFTLPCAHYTTGQFPFNALDGLAMCRYLAGNL